ncbi:GAF domain-containing protein [Neoaquamicrobium sediminum]|uniref:GAF domain-containing protein n=1 Tax=Neoaquamicrobium sediminum TaxID=1849104 RepID=UPI003BAA7CCA
MTNPDAVISLIDEAGAAALSADGPEAAIHELARRFFDLLGDRTAHEREGGLKPGERQFFVAGAFLVTPDEKYHMLVGNRGFPDEQRRLLVPIDAGHPGWVYLNKRELILENTDDHGAFRQYLKTSRMGSTIFAPMFWKGRFMGQLIMAAQARHTMRQSDLAALKAISRLAAALWVAHDGPAWLEAEYPPSDGFYVDREGVK